MTLNSGSLYPHWVFAIVTLERCMFRAKRSMSPTIYYQWQVNPKLQNDIWSEVERFTGTWLELCSHGASISRLGCNQRYFARVNGWLSSQEGGGNEGRIIWIRRDFVAGQLSSQHSFVAEDHLLITRLKQLWSCGRHMCCSKKRSHNCSSPNLMGLENVLVQPLKLLITEWREAWSDGYSQWTMFPKTLGN